MTHTVPSTLATAAARSGCDDAELGRFVQHLDALPLYQAARINPFAFADAAGIKSDTAVDLFVHGAKLGLFDLEWGMVCPLCGAITHSVPELDQVAEDVLHCSLCNRDVAALLDDTVEVSFAYAPPGSTLDLHSDFAAYQHYHTSSSYPIGSSGGTTTSATRWPMSRSIPDRRRHCRSASGPARSTGCSVWIPIPGRSWTF